MPDGVDPLAALIRYTTLRWLESAFPRGARVVAFGLEPEQVAYLRSRDVEVLGVDGQDDSEPADGACLAVMPADGARIGSSVGRRLRAGAPVRVCIPGRVSMAALIARALRGYGERRWNPSMADVLESLGPDFVWQRARGAGIVLPGGAHRAWAEAHPQLFAVLATLDAIVAPIPLLRAFSERIVVEGRRR
jgi:hypothetical protein